MARDQLGDGQRPSHHRIDLNEIYQRMRLLIFNVRVMLPLPSECDSDRPPSSGTVPHTSLLALLGPLTRRSYETGRAARYNRKS